MRLLMLCMGNICRSPMAEGALRARLQAAGLANDVEIDSAGTGDWHAGDPPDPRAIATAAAHGVDIAMLRARKIEAADFNRFDWILCADHDNLTQARKPNGSRARLALLREWAGCDASREIPDPYTGGAREFEQAWSLVDEAAARIVERIRAGCA
ncbi:low molecular weight phosphotyrosine protein phosphatase [Pseudoluteimonas lycopersici]|uniref:protein-tyrosine-phosphatase n=1 Tax=Pseudoluteimonas lycopersici TaxID=1324796 RepID=A0A516V885_9GAMM|nr:low molecular weight protein-tyrosine-phosphatase [Lysobacter lycopersici]QDQ74743.1 low molecular weight phosphotyrosine protein phosphatase [Lysobacter lycopersici]